MIRAISTLNAPLPAGTYSQGVVAEGRLVFISGQTPRLPDGTRLASRSFREQAYQALTNLESIARASGLSVATHAAKVTVYLKDLEDRHEFDELFAQFTGDVPPARAIVQSGFTMFDIEVDAILVDFARPTTPGLPT